MIRNDEIRIHISPREVARIESLAAAHGMDLQTYIRSTLIEAATVSQLKKERETK